MITEKVKNTIEERKLLRKGDTVLVGLSGGADSVCLTHILNTLKDELGIRIISAHLNHNIRGAEALRDARFAAEFSKSLDIFCEQKSMKIRDIAKEKGISEETAGREARYEFFNEAAAKHGCTKIATAHNRNDNAETVLMNFMRGSSLAGLAGIPYNRGEIIRPLLDVTRAEIEEYCRLNGLTYVTDSTNETDNYTRNKIRHLLIPMIEDNFNPNFINTVSKNSSLIGSDEEFIADCANAKYAELVNNKRVKIKDLLKCRAAVSRRLVRRMIADVSDLRDVSSDFSERVIKLVKTGKTGSSITLPYHVEARIEYEYLVIDKEACKTEYEYSLPLNQDICIKEAGITIRAEHAEKRENDGAQYFSGVNADNLTVRSRRRGDIFYPSGMRGRKKIKDYFINEKIPRQKRETVPIITSGDDIIYVVPYRRDERFAFLGSGIKIIIK